jgi:hypothetical protein
LRPAQEKVSKTPSQQASWVWWHATQEAKTGGLRSEAGLGKKGRDPSEKLLKQKGLGS